MFSYMELWVIDENHLYLVLHVLCTLIPINHATFALVVCAYRTPMQVPNYQICSFVTTNGNSQGRTELDHGYYKPWLDNKFYSVYVRDL